MILKRPEKRSTGGAARGIILKSSREIELMRRAGRIVHQVHARLRELVRPGVTTGELNAEAERMIEAAGGIALFKGVVNPQARFPFPAALCTSVNDELVHGIPGSRALKSGDVVSVDCGVRLEGYCGDAAVTHPVGPVAPEVQRLLDVTKGALDLAIAEIRPGRRWSEVARAIQAYVEKQNFSVVREFVGHGIGRDMHEEPKVPNYWARDQVRLDFELVENLVIAIEPMVNMGSHKVEFGGPDGWVVVTRDGQYAAHFEHTVAVTSSGADILTDGR
jgi:methionyl aminopeptidase